MEVFVIRVMRFVIACALVAGLFGVGTVSAHHKSFKGKAVYYSNLYAGRTMACGGTYQPWKMVAAHRTLPCGTKLRVKNRANGRIVKVTVRDRGPYTDGYVLDLSRRAAKKLRYLNAGVAKVKATILH